MNPVLASSHSYFIFVCTLSKHPTSRSLQLYSLTTINNEVSLRVISSKLLTAVTKYVYIIFTEAWGSVVDKALRY